MKKKNSELSPWPFYERDEIEAVARVLESGSVNYRGGIEGKKFEHEFANYCKAKYALTVTNGTAALEIALEALDIKKDDEVIVPARTFIATASGVFRRNAKVIVADININSQNLDEENLHKVITPRTRAIIPVHLSGLPVEMEPILKLAQVYNIKIIEDCAQAHGAKYKNQYVGTIGDIGCFSFCQDKIISTGGEGGMIITNNESLFKKMWSIRDHGRNFDRVNTPNDKTGFKWVVDTFGSNFRMTESQSAIGRIQLKKLDNWLKMRRRNANLLSSFIKDLNIVIMPKIPRYMLHSYYNYNILLNEDVISKHWDRDTIIDELTKKGIPARVGACPDITREQAFKNHGFSESNERINANKIGNLIITLPIHHTLTNENINFIGENVREVLKKASI